MTKTPDVREYADLLCVAMLHHRLNSCRGNLTSPPSLVGTRNNVLGMVVPTEHCDGPPREVVSDLVWFAFHSKMSRWVVTADISIPSTPLPKLGLEVTCYSRSRVSRWEVLRMDDTGGDELPNQYSEYICTDPLSKRWDEHELSARRAGIRSSIERCASTADANRDAYALLLPWTHAGVTA
jgi:hypothetical protein